MTDTEQDGALENPKVRKSGLQLWRERRDKKRKIVLHEVDPDMLTCNWECQECPNTDCPMRDPNV